jgi:broad specificity phosphatase PhoE
MLTILSFQLHYNT